MKLPSTPPADFHGSVMMVVFTGEPPMVWKLSKLNLDNDFEFSCAECEGCGSSAREGNGAWYIHANLDPTAHDPNIVYCHRCVVSYEWTHVQNVDRPVDSDPTATYFYTELV